MRKPRGVLFPGGFLFTCLLDGDRFKDTNKMSIPQRAPYGSQNLIPHPPVCHRCGGLAPRRGRMSASVEDDNGIVRKLYLCRLCISALGSWHALARHAEAAELESQRQRFQTRRTADRRAA